MDGGDFTGPHGESASTRALFVLEVMGSFGYDATTVGVLDLALGKEMLLALGQSGPVPIVSANLLDSDTAKPAFREAVRVERDGVRVGITAVALEEDAREESFRAGGFTLADPVEAARRVLRSLREDTEVTVLMIEGDLRESQAFGERIADLADVVVVGNVTRGRPIAHPEHGGSVYLTAANRGQAFGRARIALNDDGRIDRIVGDEILLGRDEPEEPTVLAMVDDFQTRLNELLRDQALMRAREERGADGHAFLGAMNCRDCHVREYELWMETPHAHAFQTLVDAGRESLPECFGCHVTGHGDPTGYLPGTADARTKIGVQCEVCHDQGTRHARDGSYGRERLMQSCQGCHDSDNSPNFDPEVYWLMIEH